MGMMDLVLLVCDLNTHFAAYDLILKGAEPMRKK